MPEQRKTVCNRDCPDACGIVATVDAGRVIRLAGDPDHPVTRGFLCWRTNQFLETQYSKERLTTPLRRVNGTLQPIGWDEALDWAATELLRIREESGPAAIFHYRSGGSLGLLKFVSDYFFERFGPCTTKRGDICSGAGEAAQLLDFGVCDSNDLFDLINARHVLLWGKNVVTSSPHTVPILDEAKRRGAELVLIDPVRHQTAKRCARFFQPIPGGDFALAMAVARVLFERGWIDASAHEFCDHLDEFRALALSRSVDDWCREADVRSSAAEDLARRLGPEKPCAILVGWGMGRRTNGGAIVRALDALAAVSGNLGISGGGVSFYFRRRGAFDTSFVRGIEAAPRTIPEPLFGPAVLEAKDPPIRAIWVTAGNPVAMLPESSTTAHALETRDFVVVVDSVLTDTARRAHLVLPTTTLLESDDLLGSYGHHFLAATRPVVDPPAEARSDLEIVHELARRTGLAGAIPGDPRVWKERLVATKLRPAGASLEDLEAAPTRNPLAAHILFADRRFSTSTGRVNLVTEAPDSPDPPSPDWPLALLSLSTPKSQSSQWAKSPPDQPVEVRVHPDAAGDLIDGAEALLESPRGSLRIVVRVDAGQRRDVALMAKGGHLGRGACPNALVTARLTDLGEGGALYEERVRIVPL